MDASSKILLDAADYIEKHGWCQKSFLDHYGRVCVLGAMTRIRVDNCEAERRLINHIKNSGGVASSSVYSLISWNDDPTQTKENVVATLRAAAVEK